VIERGYWGRYGRGFVDQAKACIPNFGDRGVGLLLGEVEGFFGLVKNGIRGVYHSVSIEYLQRYLDEYTFRYNQRNSRTPMFWAMLSRVEKNAGPAAAAA